MTVVVTRMFSSEREREREREREGCFDSRVFESNVRDVCLPSDAKCGDFLVWIFFRNVRALEDFFFLFFFPARYF